MTSWALDANGDIYLDDAGNIALVTGVAELIQNVNCSLKLWLGEYAYDTSQGVNYQRILSNPHLASEVLDYYVTTAIMLPNNYLTAANLASYGIKEITSIDYAVNQDTRQLTITAKITLNNGTTTTVSTGT